MSVSHWASLIMQPKFLVRSRRIACCKLQDFCYSLAKPSLKEPIFYRKMNFTSPSLKAKRVTGMSKFQAIVVSVVIFILGASSFLLRGGNPKKTTQQYIDTANLTLAAGFSEGKKCYTSAGESAAIIQAIAKAKSVSVPIGGDKEALQKYLQMLKEMEEWYNVRPTWKTSVGYGLAGAAAGAVDALGGSGIATTSLFGFWATDVDSRSSEQKELFDAIAAWVSFCKIEGYESGF